MSSVEIFILTKICVVYSYKYFMTVYSAYLIDPNLVKNGSTGFEYHNI